MLTVPGDDEDQQVDKGTVRVYAVTVADKVGGAEEVYLQVTPFASLQLVPAFYVV